MYAQVKSKLSLYTRWRPVVRQIQLYTSWTLAPEGGEQSASHFACSATWKKRPEPTECTPKPGLGDMEMTQISCFHWRHVTASRYWLHTADSRYWLATDRSRVGNSDVLYTCGVLWDLSGHTFWTATVITCVHWFGCNWSFITVRAIMACEIWYLMKKKWIW